MIRVRIEITGDQEFDQFVIDDSFRHNEQLQDYFMGRIKDSIMAGARESSRLNDDFTDQVIDQILPGLRDVDQCNMPEDEEVRSAQEGETEPLPFDDPPITDEEIMEMTAVKILLLISDFVDPLTDEVNCTALAEQTAIELDHPEWLDDEQHFIWDLAVDAGQAHEKNIRQQMEQDPISSHHPDCQCARCYYGDDAYLAHFHGSEY